MSNLITVQNEKKTGKNNNKQDSKKKKTDSGEDSSSLSEYKKKTPQKGLRKRTFDSSSSDSDSDQAGTQKLPNRNDYNYLYLNGHEDQRWVTV